MLFGEIMKIIVLLNLSAGSSGREEADRVRQAFQNAGTGCDILQAGPGKIGENAREAAKRTPDIIAAGGGDGTVSAAASALIGAGTGTALGVLPLGTLNHFAKDLRIPADLEEAVRLFARPVFRSIDAGQVNGRHFINNSSIGLYPRLVRMRDEQRYRLGRGKWFAMLIAFAQLFRRLPGMTVRLEAEGLAVRRQTPFVFVGNNTYSFSLFDLGGREALDRGVLSLYTAQTAGRFTLISLAVRSVLGMLDQGRDFEYRTAREIWIETRRPEISVALDGEVVRLKTPLHYESLKGALKVVAPPEPQA